MIIETRRGPEQFLRIFESLARAELTDGLTFSQLRPGIQQPPAPRRHRGGDPDRANRTGGHLAGQPAATRLRRIGDL